MEFGQALDALDQEVQAGEIKKMLGGEHDRKNAIVTVHPGRGGHRVSGLGGDAASHVPAMDRAARFQARNDRLPARRGSGPEECDADRQRRVRLRSAVGRSRNPPPRAHVARSIRRRDATHRFASVHVWPELSEDVAVDIEDKDLRIDTYRSSGAGGQHVNVTDSAVRLTHIPTGIVVSCQNERSQHRNRDSAMKVLQSRLYDLRSREQQAKLDQISGVKKEIAFGHQIRSYVLHPYQLVKDHRTKEQVGDVTRVLDGDIDFFIKAFLMKKSSGTLGEAPADDDVEPA